MIRIIKGNDGVSVSTCLRICKAIVNENALTIDLYTLHCGDLMLFKYMKGKFVSTKLFNSIEVSEELERVVNLNAEYINV